MIRLIFVFLSLIGMLNGLVWAILYWFWPKRKRELADKLMGLLLLALVIRIAKSVALIWTGLPFFIIHLGLSAFMAVGPLLYMFYCAQFNPHSISLRRIILHLSPVAVHLIIVLFLTFERGHWIWQLRYGMILGWVAIYLIQTFFRFRKQILPLSVFKNKGVSLPFFMVLLFWLFYLTHWQFKLFPYGSSAVVFALYTYLIMFIHLKDLRKSGRRFYPPESLQSRRHEQLGKSLMNHIQQADVFTNSLLTLPTVAHHLKISPHELSAVLNNYIGRSFPDLLNEVRLSQVIKILESPEYKNQTISQIAYSCGFNSLSTFNGAFKRRTGITPSQFRKQIAN